jgi:glycosyltransferase involved in cell wall biosynthesis
LIIVIDDGSKDRTSDIIIEHQTNDQRIELIKHMQNKGVGAAIISGYKRSLDSKADIAVVMAGDNQMDPQYIPNLLDPIIEGKADYTKGNRLFNSKYREGMSTWRFIGNSMLTFLTKIASGYWQLMDPQNGYTAISKHALEIINLDKIFTYYGYCNDILINLNIYGLKIQDIPIPARYGNEKSKIKYGKYIQRVSKLLLKGFFHRLKMKYIILSFNPLVFFYLMGLMITPLSIILGIYSLYYKFILDGDLFIRAALSMLLFIVGIQFLFFAMLFDLQNERNQ